MDTEEEITMKEKIGFIGLGIMGKPMAINLVNAGYSVWVHARRPHMMEPLTEIGATACSTSREVSENCDIIITNVSDTPDVEQIIIGEHGIIYGASEGCLVIDMSTISPSATRAIASQLSEKNIDMLDAPVSGGEKGAIEGNLSIMIGGSEDSVNRAMPVFEVLGKNIVHIGANGAGQVAKACNQVIIAQSIAAIGEAYILAQASGVAPEKVRAALMGGFAGSRVLEAHGQRMLDRNFQPGFKARLHHKDMRIAMEAAHELGIALPGAAQATQYLNALVGTGKGEDDSIAILQLQEAMSGVTVNHRKE